LGYLVPDPLSCQACHSSCRACHGPSATDCLTCATGVSCIVTPRSSSPSTSPSTVPSASPTVSTTSTASLTVSITPTISESPSASLSFGSSPSSTRTSTRTVTGSASRSTSRSASVTRTHIAALDSVTAESFGDKSNSSVRKSYSIALAVAVCVSVALVATVSGVVYYAWRRRSPVSPGDFAVNPLPAPRRKKHKVKVRGAGSGVGRGRGKYGNSSDNDDDGDGALAGKHSPRKDDKKDEEEGPTCVICMAHAPVYAMLPCGHRLLCEHGCAETFMRQTGGRKCPTCRHPVANLVRIYDP
jgi:hypothetical protein